MVFINMNCPAYIIIFIYDNSIIISLIKHKGEDFLLLLFFFSFVVVVLLLLLFFTLIILGSVFPLFSFVDSGGGGGIGCCCFFPLFFLNLSCFVFKCPSSVFLFASFFFLSLSLVVSYMSSLAHL